jgi:hypothetical protein
MHLILRSGPLVAVLLAIAACSESATSTEPLKLWSIEFGTGADTQNKITGATRTFAPGSTVYASIGTTGSGHATLLVEWAAGSTIVQTEKREIDSKSGDHFAFHFVPPEGWPPGTNRVRFSFEDGEKHVAEFQVQ